MSDFKQMRASLVERGMLDGAGRITPAGMDYTDRIIADLKSKEAPAIPAGLAVVWDTRRVKVRA